MPITSCSPDSGQVTVAQGLAAVAGAVVLALEVAVHHEPLHHVDGHPPHLVAHGKHAVVLRVEQRAEYRLLHAFSFHRFLHYLFQTPALPAIARSRRPGGGSVPPCGGVRRPLPFHRRSMSPAALSHASAAEEAEPSMA